jgi:hypothetical protein
MSRGAAAGFDWLWLMDDDLEPFANALEALVGKKSLLEETSPRPFLLNCLVLSNDPADGDTLAFPLQEITAKGYPRLGVYHWRLSEVADKIGISWKTAKKYLELLHRNRYVSMQHKGNRIYWEIK